MANPFRKAKIIGRTVGRSLLKMKKREKTRQRKAERYFGEQEEVIERSPLEEDIVSSNLDEELSTGHHDEDFDLGDDEEGFF